MKLKYLSVLFLAVYLVQTAFASGGGLVFYNVTKGAYYHQDPDGAPILRPYKPWYFEARMLFTNGSSIIFANVIPPGTFFGTPLFPQYDYIKREDTKNRLDSDFPNGTYQFSFFVNVGPFQYVSNVLSAGPFPPPPAIANLSDAQSINPSNDFTLTWNPFTGGRTNDLIFCTIQTVTGMVLQTSNVLGAPNTLTGTATSILIPANSLKSGHSYIGRLGFVTAQAIVTNQYPGAFGASTYVSQSDFYIRTTGAGDTTPPLVVSTFPVNGSTALPTNIPVVITFNKPMSQSWSISWSGGASTNWSDGFDMSLTRFGIWPTLDFTTNQPHIIVLNGLDNKLLFADTNANLLAPDTMFSFTTTRTSYNTNTPFLSGPRPIPSGGLQLDLLSASGTSAVLLGSTNLTDWYPIVTNPPFAGTVNFTDPNTPAPATYYRTVGY